MAGWMEVLASKVHKQGDEHSEKTLLHFTHNHLYMSSSDTLVHTILFWKFWMWSSKFCLLALLLQKSSSLLSKNSLPSNPFPLSFQAGFLVHFLQKSREGELHTSKQFPPTLLSTGLNTRNYATPSQMKFATPKQILLIPSPNLHANSGPT